MKKVLYLSLMILISISLIASFSLTGCKTEDSSVENEAQEEEIAEEEVEEIAEEVAEEEIKELGPATITVSDWGTTEDLRGVIAAVAAAFNEIYPQITIEHSPVEYGEYQSKLVLDLELGVGADIFKISNSYKEQIYATGAVYEFDETIIPNLADFDQSQKDQYTADSGLSYAIPYFAYLQGIAYHKDMLAENGLEEPTTWEELLDACKVLKDNGIVPMGLGVKTAHWPSALFFSTIGVDFYGGEDGRAKLVSGELLFTDQPFVDTFAALNDLVPYLPDNWVTIDVPGMQEMFMAREFAMMINGNWLFGGLEAGGYDLDNLGWMDSPPPAGKEAWTCMPTAEAYAINTNSENLEAALVFVDWLNSEEAFKIQIANGINGLPTRSGDFSFANAPSVKAFEITQEIKSTPRLAGTKLDGQDPTTTGALLEAITLMWQGDLTPEEAAQYVHDQVSTWYEPFQE